VSVGGDEGVILLLTSEYHIRRDCSSDSPVTCYYLWHVFLAGYVTLMPRFLTRKARASFICHLERKIVGVEAKKEVW